MRPAHRDKAARKSLSSATIATLAGSGSYVGLPCRCGGMAASLVKSYSVTRSAHIRANINANTQANKAVPITPR